MEFIHTLVHFILHSKDDLELIVARYGTVTYIIMFAIIFCETGLVVTPFLPGDSLLFGMGIFIAAHNTLSFPLMVVLLVVAAFTGNLTNYGIGRFIGPVVYEKNYKLIRRKYLDQAHDYFEKHGALTIVYTRFAPFLRTFAPFVAGVSKMPFGTFILYNFIGGFAWILALLCAGFFLGQVPFVNKNYEVIVIGIIVVSLIPAVIAFIKGRGEKVAS